MKVRAPGKLLLSGAYAVLEGAPAIVMAVDRHAIADDEQAADVVTGEMRTVWGDEPVRRVDSSALYDGRTKLGLGSSAASLVAAIGLSMARRGERLDEAAVRARIFEKARTIHAAAQSGGSGVDIAASVHGGLLRFVRRAAHIAEASMAMVDPLPWPSGLCVRAFWTGTSARTQDLRGAVERLRSRSPRAYASRLDELSTIAATAADAFASGDVVSIIEATGRASEGLYALGMDSDAPIVTDSMKRLAERARAAGGACMPSGAGGGDVLIWIGQSAPPDGVFSGSSTSSTFSPTPLAVSLDSVGVMIADATPVIP